MLDWASITALCAATTVVGGTLGALVHHTYARGGFDKTVADKAEAAQNLAAACLAKLDLFSDSLHRHQIEDAAAFGELKAMVSENGRAQVAAEHRIAQAIEDFGHAINNMTQRIDLLMRDRKGS